MVEQLSRRKSRFRAAEARRGKWVFPAELPQKARLGCRGILRSSKMSEAGPYQTRLTWKSTMFSLVLKGSSIVFRELVRI